MTKSSLWTIVGVVVAIAIAWFLVNVLFTVLALVFKLLVVAVVAVGVFLVLRHFFGGAGDTE